MPVSDDFLLRYHKLMRASGLDMAERRELLVSMMTDADEKLSPIMALRRIAQIEEHMQPGERIPA